MEPNKQNTALLVMDVQQAIISMLGAASENYLSTVAAAIKNARAKNIPVIYVVIGFRKGFPDANPNGRMFSRLKEMKFDMEEASRVHSAVAPQADEAVVIKKRVSAFSGSDLEVLLRSMGINHIVLSGIATSGVVLSTLREAADKDYQITVLADACADGDPEVHRVLTEKVFVRQADVMTVEEWAKK